MTHLAGVGEPAKHPSAVCPRFWPAASNGSIETCDVCASSGPKQRLANGVGRSAGQRWAEVRFGPISEGARGAASGEGRAPRVHKVNRRGDVQRLVRNGGEYNGACTLRRDEARLQKHGFFVEF